jgi:DNA-binding MarR family transcriptional regulator
MSDEILALERFLPYRLNRLADAVSRDFSRIYREKFGLTRPEWRVLAALGELGTMTATEVGRHSSQHKTKVSRAVAALEKRRWLTRAEDEADRRVERLTLTRAGQDAYGELVPLAKAFDRQLWEGISAAREAEFDYGLERLEQKLLGKGL